MNGKEVAKKFWQSKEQYPPYEHIKERRLFELNFLLPRLKGKTLVDIGCGDGALLNCLYHLTDMQLFGLDISTSLMKGVNPNIKTYEFDCYDPPFTVDMDVVILAGVIQYIFEDDKLSDLLRDIHSPLLFVRSACASEDEIVNKKSKELGEQYASRYRTVDQVRKLLGEFFLVTEVERIYPDKIESKFGTKQYYFVCERRASLTN